MYNYIIVGRRISKTEVRVQLIKLELNKTMTEKIDSVRTEAARCWNYIVKRHKESRESPDTKWLSSNDLEQETKGKYELHSQTVQGLCQRLESNIKTWVENRKTDKDAKAPYKEVEFQTPSWKVAGIIVNGNRIILSMGGKREPLILKVPECYANKNVVRAEITYKDNSYWLCLTEDTGIEAKPVSYKTRTAGIDLGIIHNATVVTEDGNGMSVSGRYLRSIKRQRNKSVKELDIMIKRCKNGSKRHRKLVMARKKINDRSTRKERDVIHKSTRKVVEFCEQENIAKVAIGDVKNIQHNGSKGQETNQWIHGQTRMYLEYKFKNAGIRSSVIDESYSSRTCPCCLNVLKTSPRDRNYSCPSCGISLHRDGVGGANICSKGRFGAYGSVVPKEIIYLQPINLGSSSLADTQQVARYRSRSPRL